MAHKTGLHLHHLRIPLDSVRKTQTPTIMNLTIKDYFLHQKINLKAMLPYYIPNKERYIVKWRESVPVNGAKVYQRQEP